MRTPQIPALPGMTPLGIAPTLTVESLALLRRFIGPAQMAALRECLVGEEGAWFRATLATLTHRIATMPKTYEQDGLGDAAIVYLHYFTPAGDWYITEKDDEAVQHQAFGLANLGYPELGYVSLPEILAAGAELDLHWAPKPLAEIR